MTKKNFLERLYPRDIIAAILLILLFVLKFAGLDGIVDSALALIVGYYFSKRVFEETKK